MEEMDELHCSKVKVLVDVFQQAESNEKYNQAFGCLKDGYNTKTASDLLMFHISPNELFRVAKRFSRYKAKNTKINRKKIE